jgi:hypothetical protein
LIPKAIICKISKGAGKWNDSICQIKEDKFTEQELQDVNGEVNDNTMSSKIGNEFITPGALRDHFHKLFVNESELCTMLYCA